MRVLGIDPGTVVTGYGILDEEDRRLLWVTHGEIKTSSRLPLSTRLRKIYDDLSVLIASFRPDRIVLENTFLAKNFQTAMKLGQARGMALLAAEMGGIPVEEYTPSEVKLAVVGYGGATKEQVQQMVGQILRLVNTPSSHHATDALSVAVCHVHSAKIRELTRPGLRGRT